MSEAIVLKAPTPADPQQLLMLAVEKGLDPSTLEQMMNLQERWQAGQARKAFVIAMSQFKAEVPPVLSKDATVDFNSQKGRTHYRYANLGSIVAIVTPLLSRHELSASWETSQNDKGEVIVTCHVTHSAGHRESVTLRGQPDNSGNKNPIQMIGSTVEYLRRYTFLCATGLATGDVDTDGLPEVKPVGGSAANTTPPARTAPTSTPRPTALVDTVTEAEIRSLYDRAKAAGADATRVPEVLATEFPYILDAVGAVHLLALKRADYPLAQTICGTIKPVATAPAAAPSGVFHEVWPEQEFTDKTVKTVASVAAINDPVKSEKTGKYGPFKIDLKNAEDGVLFTVETFHKTLAETCKAAGDTLREIAFDEVVNGRFTNRYLVGVR